MSDLISRRAAIEAVGKYIKVNDNTAMIADVVNAVVDLEQLPSAGQIIRCKDCKHYSPFICRAWSKYGTIQTIPEGFCYKAERIKGGKNE